MAASCHSDVYGFVPCPPQRQKECSLISDGFIIYDQARTCVLKKHCKCYCSHSSASNALCVNLTVVISVIKRFLRDVSERALGIELKPFCILNSVSQVPSAACSLVVLSSNRTLQLHDFQLLWMSKLEFFFSFLNNLVNWHIFFNLGHMSLLTLLLLWKFKYQILTLTCFVSPPDYYFIKLLCTFLWYFSKKLKDPVPFIVHYIHWCLSLYIKLQNIV